MKFLGTFAAFTQLASSYVPQGINEGNIAYVKAVVPSSMSPGDTLAITVPSGQDPGLMPSEVWFPTIYQSGSPPSSVQTYGNALITVSHDVTKGITVLTAPTGITAGAIVMLEYIGGEA